MGRIVEREARVRKDDESKMKRKPEEYIDCGFYEGSDIEDIANYQQKVVKCRKGHICNACQQLIKKGDYALRETGFMDGAPLQSYVCIPCLDEWLDEIEPLEGDEKP